MTNDFLPYALPFIEEEDVQAVGEVIRSNWLTTGPKTRQFESEFSRKIGRPAALALNSCTAGLHLLLKAAGIGPGDEVILPDMTFCATANTVCHVGAKPVFVDIDPASLDLTVEKLSPRVNERTKALMPVHYGGNPCDMKPLWDFAERNNLLVIEDCAHAMGTYYRGKHVGSEGDGAAFSFYATKNLTTGEGGMVTFRPEWEARLRMLALHGMSRDAFRRYEKGGSWYYEVEEPGFKYNMTDMQAALGLTQLAKFERMQERRKWIVEEYHRAFGDIPGLRLPPVSPREGDVHAWHLYYLRLEGFSRDRFIAALTEEGIGTSVHFIPLHRHPAYRDLGLRPDDFPVAEATYQDLVSLPLYPAMSDESVERVIGAVRRIAEESR